MSTIPARRLEEFCVAILQRAGCSLAHAHEAAQCLVSANLEGIDTHGVARLAVYARRIARGLINPEPSLTLQGGRGGLAVLDGDNGLGPVVAQEAMRQAVHLAREFGIGWVLARNSNHYAHAGYYAAAAAREGMVGITSSSGEPNVAPWGGVKAFFTNNPVAIAAPCGDDVIVVDMATSVAARGQILLAARTGRQIPANWALDADGEPTTDANAALLGSVLPMGGAKGYALILGLEILTGILGGGEFAPHVGSQQDTTRAAGVSQFFAAIDPTAIMSAAEFAERMNRLSRDLHAAPRREGGEDIRLPGERRAAIVRERQQNGIPLAPEIVNELKKLAEEFGIPESDRLHG